jgi:hypothetical protein
MILDLKKLGQTEVAKPDSLATCLDFVSIWASDPNRAILGRICAGAIGVCATFKRLPSYKVTSGDPVGYGHQIMDRLLEAGIPPSYIYDRGAQCLMMMANGIPVAQEVETTADFLAPPEEADLSG